MPDRLSRRKIANYVADRLLAEDGQVIDQLAALLVHENRQREIDLIVRNIHDALESRGMVVTTVSSAHPLSDEIRSKVKDIIGGDKVLLREKIDETLIGGIKIDAAGKRYDGTVKYKLSELRAQKI